MRSVSITVTEASRNFADCINRARYQGTTFVLYKGGVAVARIVPEPKAPREPKAEPESKERMVVLEQVRAGGEGAGEDPVKDLRAIW
jgi:antitoxin (DNA-binding transcriptional repressor) of toxin-antitoxin stability system